MLTAAFLYSVVFKKRSRLDEFEKTDEEKS
jgi:hypothetical protein